MAVTMEDVRAALDPDEPDYSVATELGPDAIPHLEVLVNSGDQMLASKAAYLASLIKDPRSKDVVKSAAQSDDPVVRVAAAAAAANLSASVASAVLVDLVTDEDSGVRKVARSAVPDKPSADLAQKLEALGTAQETAGEPTASPTDSAPLGTGLMPGETDLEATGGARSIMPGEGPGTMPGEQSKMPGE